MFQSAYLFHVSVAKSQVKSLEILFDILFGIYLLHI